MASTKGSAAQVAGEAARVAEVRGPKGSGIRRVSKKAMRKMKGGYTAADCLAAVAKSNPYGWNATTIYCVCNTNKDCVGGGWLAT